MRLLILFFCVPWGLFGAFGAEVIHDPLLNGVPFPELQSPDKRFAIGWTMLRVGINGQEIDRNRDGVPRFLDLSGPKELTEQESADSIQNVFMDRETGNILVMQSRQPMWPGKSRGHLSVAWSPSRESGVVALVANDVRFFTANLWVVEFQTGALKVTDLVPKLTKRLEAEIQRLSGARGSGLFFVIEPEQPEERVIFGRGEMDVFFRAEFPKAEEGPALEGVVTLRRDDWEVVRIRSAAEIPPGGQPRTLLQK
jgi:hypothetical protein